MAVEEANSANAMRRWSTAVLCTLAFVAVANLAITCARIVFSGTAGHSTIRLALEAGAALFLPLLALKRVGRGGLRADASARVPEPEDDPPRTRPYRWLRRARWLLTPVLIVVAFVSISGQWDTVSDAVGQLAHLHWRYVRLAVYAEALSTVAFALLGWILLRGRGARLALRSIIALTVASNALSVSMPAGQALAGAFSFDQLRRRGVGRRTAVGVLISTVVISAVALGLLVATGVELAGGHGPAAPFRIVVALGGGALAIAAAVAIRTRRAGLLRLIPAPRVLLPAFGAALGNWITDCACLVAAILAAGGHVPWSALLVVYGVGQVASNLPITPGGVGIVEGALSVMLVAYGMHPITAVAAVLVYRIISFWVQVPIGLATAAAMALRPRRHADRLRANSHSDVATLPVAS